MLLLALRGSTLSLYSDRGRELKTPGPYQKSPLWQRYPAVPLYDRTESGVDVDMITERTVVTEGTVEPVKGTIVELVVELVVVMSHGATSMVTTIIGSTFA